MSAQANNMFVLESHVKSLQGFNTEHSSESFYINIYTNDLQKISRKRKVFECVNDKMKDLRDCESSLE